MYILGVKDPGPGGAGVVKPGRIPPIRSYQLPPPSSKRNQDKMAKSKSQLQFLVVHPSLVVDQWKLLVE